MDDPGIVPQHHWLNMYSISKQRWGSVALEYQPPTPPNQGIARALGEV